jgi:hypothetical protein
MGLFDGQGMGGAMPKNLAEMGRGVGQSLGRGFLDPYMESKGFISEENRILDVMKDVDLTNPESFSEGFRKIMEISPQAAKEFRTQAMPILNANLEGQALGIEQQKLKAVKAPTGTAENIARESRRLELIKQNNGNEELGNSEFRRELQAEKIELETAAVQKEVGLDIFRDTKTARSVTQTQINKVNTAIDLFIQASANPAAAALAENVITDVLDNGNRKAVSEIRRLAEIGSITDKAFNFASEVLSGVKTQAHYDSFLETLAIYKEEQSKIYNKQTDEMKSYNSQYKLGVPEIQFTTKDIPKGQKTDASSGKTILTWTEETGIR